MIAAAVSKGLRLVHEQTSDNGQLLAKWLQRGQGGRELKVGADACRQPFVVDDAVRMVDNSEATDSFGRSLSDRCERRHHGVKQRQRDGRTKSSENRSTGERLLRQNHGAVLLIRNGALFTSATIMDDQR